MAAEHLPPAIIESETAILAGLPEHGYSSVEHWRGIWPEDGETAALFNWAAHTPRGISAEADRLATVYSKNHRGFLSTVADDLEARIQKDKSLVAQPFGTGDESNFGYKNDVRPPLDLKALGLPSLEESEKLEPLAVVIHRQADDEAVTCVELLVKNDQRIEGRFLEDIRAAAGAKNDTMQRWIKPGHSLLSSAKVEPVAEQVGTLKSDQSVTKLKAVSLYGKAAGRTEIIRPKLTRFEKQVAQPDYPQRVGRYIRAGRALAAVTAAFSGLFFFSPEGYDPSQNRRITTAHELVLPGGTLTHDGLTQAEAYFSEPELSRSRAAYEAYFKGDTEALRVQAQSYGYETNWMQPELVAAIEKAENYDALVAAFNTAFAGLPITLAAYTGARRPDGLLFNENTSQEPTTNFEGAKKGALEVVQLFNNVLDKDYLLRPDMEPVTYILTGEIKAQGIIAGGYFTCNQETNQNFIAISDSAGGGHLAAHETVHFEDLKDKDQPNGKWTSRVAMVNHPSHQPVDIRSHEATPIRVEGWNNVSRSYGNVNNTEGTATAGEEVLSATPIISWEHSPLGEKQMTIIFGMEKESPGFTASLLLRAREAPKDNNSLLLKLQKHHAEIGIVLALSLAVLATKLPSLASSATNWARNRRRRASTR